MWATLQAEKLESHKVFLVFGYSKVLMLVWVIALLQK